jgi:MFS family permease
MIRRYLSRLPLTDRVTFAHEMWAAALYGVMSGIALPLIPIVARTIGMGPAGIAVMLTMPFVGALSGLAFGHMADRLPRMPLVVWPSVAARSLILPLAFMRHPAGFLVFSSLFYLLSNLNAPAYASVMRSNYSDANRGRLMGNIRMISVGAAAVCSGLASIVLRHGDAGVRWLFPIAAAAGVLSTLVFGRIKVRSIPEALRRAAPKGFAASLRAVRGNIPFLVFMAIYFVATAPDKLTVPLEPIRFVDELHVDYQWAALVLGTVVSVFSVGAYYLWAKALKRGRSLVVFTVLVMFFAARFAVIAAAGDRVHLLPAGVIGGITNAGWDLVPLFCILELADPSNFSLYFGVHTTLLGVRGIIGPAIGTLLYTAGMPTAHVFWLVAALTAFGGLLMIPFMRALRRRSARAGNP